MERETIEHWEYRVLMEAHPAFESSLNAMGSEGWEAGGFAVFKGDDGKTYCWTLLKRPGASHRTPRFP